MAIKIYFPASDIRGVLSAYVALIRENRMACETLIRVALLMFWSDRVTGSIDGWNGWCVGWRV